MIVRFKTILATALTTALATAGLLPSATAEAACAFRSDTEIRMLSAGFAAWKAIAAAMADCGTVTAELDQEFRKKQPAAFAAMPALYHLGGVANGTIVPLLSERTIRPLDDLVARHGQHLKPNQLITFDGRIMAVAFMVNAQHLMYRADILADLNIPVPTTYDELLAAAETIRQAGVVDYPLGATLKTGWNLAEDFVNMHLGFGGTFFRDGNLPNVNSPAGLKALAMIRRVTAYLDPEYLASDSTYVQQQFQQGRIAMANLWASRAAAMDDAAESRVVGKVAMAAAPLATAGGRPASTLWWDGLVVAANISDQEAEIAFRVALDGIDTEMVRANNDAAVWLIDGYEAGRLAKGAWDTARAGAVAYPASQQMGLMHTALGNELAAYLTGRSTAEQALAAVEAAYMVAAREAGLIP